jgi:ADP-heptose:LPS heptosyltransferase
VHWITALDRDFRLAHLHLPANAACLAEDVNVGEIMALCPQRFRISPFLPSPPDDGAHDILFICPGGYGDLLFLEPILRHWRAAHPRARIAIVASPYNTILDGLNLSLETVPYPVPGVSVLSKFNHVFYWERRIAGAPDRHPTDVFAEALGLSLSDKLPRYHVSPSEAKEAGRKFPKRQGRPRIGFHVRATALCRTYPLHTELLTMLLLKRQYDVFLFGAPGEARADDNPAIGLTNLTNRNLNFRQSAAILATCDAFIAPDSGLLHVAGALGVLTVALFGPFPATARTCYYPTVHALQGRARCAPCHHHKRAGREWPEGGPCVTAGHCVAMADIHPKQIVAEVESLLTP